MFKNSGYIRLFALMTVSLFLFAGCSNETAPELELVAGIR